MSVLQRFQKHIALQSQVGTPVAELCRMFMRCFFLLYLFTFSVAPFFRDFFPVLCLLCLIPYYALAYKESTLAFFDGKKYFIFFYIFLALGVIFSNDIWSSFITVSLHSFTSVALPFVAMECVRTTKDLRWVAYTLVFTLCLQGLNGMYQYFTGYDFIHSLPLKSERLTGSFSDYRVGNYIALSLIPALSLVLFWRPRFKVWAAPLVLLCVGPALFLMFFSFTRNAYIAIFTALFFWTVLFRSFPWKFCLTVVLAILAVLPWLEVRFSWDVIRQDGRWDLWALGLEIFKEYPVLGAGIGQYNAAFQTLGLSPSKDAITISHPHNIYIQFLCENGILGFVLALIFLLGIFYWGYKGLRTLCVREKILREAKEKELGIKLTQLTNKGIHWRVTALYWCGWGAFLASGVVGHNFFQRWWLALAMAYLGIMIGSLVHILRHGGTLDDDAIFDRANEV